MIDYDNTATYQKGDYCMYNNSLYVANQDINTAEEFDSSHWDETSVINELETIKKPVSYELTNTPQHSYGTNSYQLNKIGNFVVLNIGLLWFDSLPSNTWTVFGNLPNALKPNQSMGTTAFVINGSNGQISAYGRIEIKTDGTLNIRTSGNVSSAYGIGIGFSTSWIID